jgi:CBS domain-containing protein
VKVRERMTPAPIVCRTDESLEAVARRLGDTDLRALPVVDARGAIAGMLTDRDLTMAALRRGAKLRDLRAADAMHDARATCGPDDELWFAAELMRVEKLRRLAVVNRDQRPIGVITLADLARHAASGPARDLDDLGMDDVIELLVEIERSAAPANQRRVSAAKKTEVHAALEAVPPEQRLVAATLAR